MADGDRFYLPVRVIPVPVCANVDVSRAGEPAFEQSRDRASSNDWIWCELSNSGASSLSAIKLAILFAPWFVK